MHADCRRCRFFLAAWVCVCLSNPFSAAAQTAPAEIPPAELRAIYQAELGALFDNSRFDETLAAHRLIEEFFAAQDAGVRKAALAQIEKSRLDPAVLGRLCRIRLGWPDLPGGVYYINERVGPHDVAYFLGIPDGYTRAKPWPLVVRLAPADPFVAQPRPDQQHVAAIYRDWITTELARHPDAIVLMPLLNLTWLYGPGYLGMNSVMEPIFHVGERANIDPARVYLIGHSLGGHAAWNLALHYPTYFAAFNPMGASARAEFQRLRLRNLRNTWPVVWHDTDDQIVKVDMARQLVRALRGLKLDVDYEETRKLGHRPPDNIADKLYEKVRSRTRSLYPRQVMLQSNRPDAIFNRVDWLQVDQPTSPGDEKRMYFSLGKEHMIVHPRPWSATATLAAANRVEVITDNVDLLRIYLNDQMIDMSKPLTVLVNSRARFEGIARPDIAAMMNDQLFLGRGWRYFIAVVEIDLATPPATRPAGN